MFLQTNLIKYFASFNQIISMENGNFVDKLKSILQNKGYPKDNEFRLRLKDTNLYGGGERARKTKIILESMEKSYNHKSRCRFMI